MDTQLVQITDLVKDYGKIIDELREKNKHLKSIINNLVEDISELKNRNKTQSQKTTTDQTFKDSKFWERQFDLRQENKVLRQALSDIAANLGNGSTVSVEASLPFIKELPHEVKLVCDGLRKALLAEQKTCNTLREELNNPPPDVQEKVLNMLGIYKGMVDLIERYNELRREVEYYLKEFPHYNGTKAFEKILQKHDEQK